MIVSLWRFLGIVTLLISAFFSSSGHGHDLTGVIKRITPSVVGVGTYERLASPTANLLGSGFAVGDGTLVATNFHVVEAAKNIKGAPQMVVFIGSGLTSQKAAAELVAQDKARDLALLKIAVKLPPLELADDALVAPGTEIVFTGFPIGAALGLYPASHRGMISAITPASTPAFSSRGINADMLRRMRDPFRVYQLDGTAYPGNSGSGVIDIESGLVVAVINKTFVKKSKESAITDPSGITYAIPVKHLKPLLSGVTN